MLFRSIMAVVMAVVMAVIMGVVMSVAMGLFMVMFMLVVNRPTRDTGLNAVMMLLQIMQSEQIQTIVIAIGVRTNV